MSLPGSGTLYLIQKLVDHASNVATYTPPSTVSLGFTTSVLDPAISTLPAGVECAGSGYARTTIDWSGNFWTNADGSGTTASKLDLQCFTATANWTTPGKGFFYIDAAGHLLYTGATTVDVFPLLGQVVEFLAGQLTRRIAQS